ncbi:MAG: protein TolQ [Bdellovibrionales bacterium]|nr:protein TolQ [Bdellovibrionales bacterium]
MNYAHAAPTETVAKQVAVTPWEAIAHASFTVQLTLGLLVVMSIVSWAIMATKRKQFNSLSAANASFLDLFWRATSLDDIFNALEDHGESSLARVFKSGYLELRKMADSGLATMASAEGSGSPLLSGIDNLERAINKSIEEELSLLESRLSFLATTGSTGPFIGLFGTVWGIMGAFQKIGATGMANLAVVAPGIAEALIATAIGLATAIPASVGYNHFIAQIRKQEIALNSFASDFINIAKRNFFKDR